MAAAALASACVLFALDGASAFVPVNAPRLAVSSSQPTHTAVRKVQSYISRRPACVSMSAVDVSESRAGFLQSSATTVIASGALAVATTAGAASPAAAAQVRAWEQIKLPVASVLYDIAFDPMAPDHGLIVGAQGTFLEVSRCWGRRATCRLCAARL